MSESPRIAVWKALADHFQRYRNAPLHTATRVAVRGGWPYRRERTRCLALRGDTGRVAQFVERRRRMGILGYRVADRADRVKPRPMAESARSARELDLSNSCSVRAPRLDRAGTPLVEHAGLQDAMDVMPDWDAHIAD